MTNIEEAEREIKIIDEIFKTRKKIKNQERSRMLEIKREILKEQMEMIENKYLSKEVTKKNER